jgi:hypothetical protein
MPNTRNPSETQTPKSGGRPGQSQDSGSQWQGNQNQEQDEDVSDDLRDLKDGQGLSNGQGETGEDEGLSGDAGDSERH